jgi:hypothetical protein
MQARNHRPRDGSPLPTEPTCARVELGGGRQLSRLLLARPEVWQRVIIDGPCLSACTLVPAPFRNRICVTCARARLHRRPSSIRKGGGRRARRPKRWPPPNPPRSKMDQDPGA